VASAFYTTLLPLLKGHTNVTASHTYTYTYTHTRELAEHLKDFFFILGGKLLYGESHNGRSEFGANGKVVSED